MTNIDPFHFQESHSAAPVCSCRGGTQHSCSRCCRSRLLYSPCSARWRSNQWSWIIISCIFVVFSVVDFLFGLTSFFSSFLRFWGKKRNWKSREGAGAAAPSGWTSSSGWEMRSRHLLMLWKLRVTAPWQHKTKSKQKHQYSRLLMIHPVLCSHIRTCFQMFGSTPQEDSHTVVSLSNNTFGCDFND